MKQEELSAMLRDFREQLAAALLSGTQPYEVGGVINYNGYVSVTTVVDKITLSMSVNEKGYICYHDKIIANLFNEGSENEKEFIGKVMEQYRINAKAYTMYRINELYAEIEQLKAEAV